MDSFPLFISQKTLKPKPRIYSLGFPCGSAGKETAAMQQAWVQPLGWEDPWRWGQLPTPSILAWRTLWTEESGRLQSMGSQTVGPD